MEESILSKNKKPEKYNLKDSKYSMIIADKYDDVSMFFCSFHVNNIFLEKNFFTALETAPPSNTRYKYVVLIEATQPIGILYFQYKKINLDLSLGLDTVVATNLKEKVTLSLKTYLAKLFRSNVLVCGNMTLTGSNASFFTEKINDNGTLITQVCEEVKKIIEKEGTKIRAILIKDFYNDNRLKEYGTYNEFMVQPNMIIDIRPSWKTFDDYIDDMRSKYRVRVRRAKKKSSHLSKKKMNLDEIRSHEVQISELYHNVVDHASFNLFMLPQDYFYQLKHKMGEDFEMIGYFLNGKMVGFSTIIFNYNTSDAHFLGYNPTCNDECLLYLNMLYDLIDRAIERRSERLVMSRTAMAIKSSVGAEPHDMYLYMKATNTLINKVMRKSLTYLEPDADWVQRSPFKD